jgi:hypothetical protein
MLRRWLALAAGAALLPACANHVRYANDSFERQKSEVVYVDAVVERQSSILKTPEVELALAIDETVIVRKLRSNVRFDVYTPYRSGYELWEVPVGIVCLPALLVLRVVDTVGIGVIPDEKLDDFSGFTWSAMNPLLNVESEDRVRRNEISRRTEELDREVKRDLRPLAGAKIGLALDTRKTQKRVTDAHGRLQVDLLALAPDSLPGRPRALRVAVAGKGKRAPRVFDLALSPPLSSRLVQAVEIRRRARAVGASPEAIGRSITELDALGFSAGALALEQELRTRENANVAWLARLDAALGP